MSSQTYTLRQQTTKTQTLTSYNPSRPSYSIQLSTTGGFMNRKPHMAIVKHINNQPWPCANIRFSANSSETTIAYTGLQLETPLKLESSQTQRYTFLIGTALYSWERSSQDRKMVELFNGAGRTIATFLYKHWAPGSEKKYDHDSGVRDIGTLKIMGDWSWRQDAFEQILCTALVVVERVKRKSAAFGTLANDHASGRLPSLMAF